MSKRRTPASPRLLVIQFLIPKFNRDGVPYPRRVHEDLRRELEERFDGWSSLGDTPLPGAWRNPESGEVEYDASWRYEVGIAAGRLPEFDEFLAVVAAHLGQKAIWRVLYEGGQGKAIPATAPDRGGEGKGTRG